MQQSDLAKITLADGSVVWSGTIIASGFDSLVSERANRMSWPKGPMRYNLAMLAELAKMKPLRTGSNSTTRSSRWTRRWSLLATGRSYGGGMLITPGASKSDGLLDLTVVGHGSRLRLVRLFPRVYKGTHVSLDAVQTYRSKKVRLVSEGIIAYADGDRVGPLPITIEAVPTALNILTHTRI